MTQDGHQMQIWVERALLPMNLEDGHVSMGGVYYEVRDAYMGERHQEYDLLKRFATIEAARSLAPDAELPGEKGYMT